ncbi:protein FAM227B [Discoglossus pictus]
MQKLPATFEEFLEVQHLKDWPENPCSEEKPLELGLKGTEYSLCAIKEDLLKNAPMDKKIFANLEGNVLQHSSLLDKYASMILDIPSSDDNLYSANETFLTEIDVPDHSGKASSQIKAVYNVTDLEKKKDIENCIFPGYKYNEFTELPGHLEAAQVLNRVVKTHNLKGGNLKMWKKMFFSEASQAILQDSFWWFYLQRFKPDHEEQDRLFDRISESFVALFWNVHHSLKDFFFKIYPDCLSRAIFTAFYEAFPKSHALFNEGFRSEIMDLIFQWVSASCLGCELRAGDANP